MSIIKLSFIFVSVFSADSTPQTWNYNKNNGADWPDYVFVGTEAGTKN